MQSKKRSFGSSSKVSLFTLGTMRVTDNQAQMYETIKSAYFSGINHLETAASYGKAEKFIGNALVKLEQKENISRKKWIITTKVLAEGDLDKLINNFNDSLKKLKLKRINNLAIHGLNLDSHLEWALHGEGQKFINFKCYDSY